MPSLLPAMIAPHGHGIMEMREYIGDLCLSLIPSPVTTLLDRTRYLPYSVLLFNSQAATLAATDAGDAASATTTWTAACDAHTPRHLCCLRPSFISPASIISQ